MYQYPWPPPYYPQQPIDPLTQINQAKEWIKALEESFKKKDDPNKKPQQMLSSFEVFVLMFALSPVTGNVILYLWELSKHLVQ